MIVDDQCQYDKQDLLHKIYYFQIAIDFLKILRHQKGLGTFKACLIDQRIMGLYSLMDHVKSLKLTVKFLNFLCITVKVQRKN